MSRQGGQGEPILQHEAGAIREKYTSEASPPSRAGLPGKEDRHFCMAPLDPALKDGACGEHAGQKHIL